MTETKSIRIAVASGKGGTGKTLVSTNLFYSLQRLEKKTALVDCDAEEPNDMLFFQGQLTDSFQVHQKVPVIDTDNCIYCGKCHDYCEYHAIFLLPEARVIRVMEDLCHGCGACVYACECEAISEKTVSLGAVNQYSVGSQSTVIEARMKIGVLSPVSVIKSAIKSANGQDIIIMDAAPGTSCPFIHTVAAADYVILVTEPTPFGLSDLKQAVNTLRTIDKPHGIIVNRSGIGDRAVYTYLEEEKIPLLLEIPFDRSVAEGYSKGDIIARYEPVWQSRFIFLFDSICQQVWK